MLLNTFSLNTDKRALQTTQQSTNAKYAKYAISPADPEVDSKPIDLTPQFSTMYSFQYIKLWPPTSEVRTGVKQFLKHYQVFHFPLIRGNSS